MRITKSKLKEIILEELEGLSAEDNPTQEDPLLSELDLSNLLTSPAAVEVINGLVQKALKDILDGSSGASTSTLSSPLGTAVSSALGAAAEE
jgi:hypothetical protein|tara:strand:+ start:1482 stop:1757 length:276 start_codon:yes stop_codon:yes gene_type:complete